MTLDDFTQRCIERVEEKPTATSLDNGNVSFSFASLLGPFITTALEYLMDRLGKCGKSNDEKVEHINSGSFGAKFLVNQSVYLASEESQIPRRHIGNARGLVKSAILLEAKETNDEELISLLDEGDSYMFDATDIWGS